MTKIEIGRWAELLKRISGVAGDRIVSGDLSPEISPVLMLEDLTDADFLYLKSVRLCFAGSAVGPVVANTSKWRLRNPTNSGVIAVVTNVEIVPPNNDLVVVIRVNQQTVDFPTAIVATAPDSRWGSIATANQTALKFTSSVSQATGPAGDTIYLSRTTVGRTSKFPFQIPLLPGTTLDFGTDSVNVSLIGDVSWRERAIPDLER